MNPLVQQLIDFLNGLALAPGSPPDTIRDVLRAIATTAILQIPADANLPPGDLDPIIVDAIQNGAQQAAAFKAAGIFFRPRFEFLPIGDQPVNPAERVTGVLGPFVLAANSLVRLVEFQSTPFRTVNQRQGGSGGVPVSAAELLMLLPHDSAPDAPDNLSWTLPAGTIWIESRFLLAGAAGFAGLRIASGKLRFDANPSFHGILLPQPGTVWTLSVQPEAPPAGNGGGTDAEALELQLPTLLEIHSNLPPAISGDLILSGFGSDLHLTPAGAVFADTNQICFPLQASETGWSITGNVSGLTQFSGESNPVSPRFTIPTSETAPEQLGEAAHGGSIAVTLSTGLASTLKGQAGIAFNWTAATLTANAARLEIQALAPDSGARYDLGVWGTSLSEVRFARMPLARLTFRSERGGFESVSVIGGSCVNKWDLPCRADGAPFPFNGAIEVFGFVSTPSGVLLTLTASAPASTELAGLALENLYVIVRPLRNLFLVAAADQAPLLPAGNAQLRFDVNVAIPTLPDPYAANLGPTPDFNGTTESALRIALTWADLQAPTLVANLDQKVVFPEPRFSLLDDTDEKAVYGAFQSHLQSQIEFLYLLDLSSRNHLFGVALESPSDHKPEIIDNRLSVPLSRVRLLLQPQVQWEPVRFVPGPVVVNEETVHSKLNGGPTLVGANSVKLTPVLPGLLSAGIIDAIAGRNPAAALFSLPFGLRAMAKLDFVPVVIQESSPATVTVLNDLVFDGFTSARQIRLFARGKGFGLDLSRLMPGMMRQLSNLLPNGANLASVLPKELQEAANLNGVPLLHADLSGYGLSTFSEWQQEDFLGSRISKIEFRVLNGRTAYEVIQFRSILYECGAPVVRTVILERGNSGFVSRVDTGWVATGPGEFSRPIPFQKGAVNSFQNIRRIRINGPVIDLDASASVQPILFDADVDIGGSLTGVVPIYDRPGYVQIKPVQPDQPQAGPVGPLPLQAPDALDLTPDQLRILFNRVGAIGSSVDCAVRLAGTLDSQISSILSDFAPGDVPGAEDEIGFAVAVLGTPKLPRAGQWTIVRVDPNNGRASAVDPRRGVPLVRNGADLFWFREPSDARLLKGARIEYALLLATETSRALFQRPRLDPNRPGEVSFTNPPILADPYSLVQSTGAFPQSGLGLLVQETPTFQVTADNQWRIDTTSFTIADVNKPTGDLLKGAGWGIARSYGSDPITLNIDSSAASSVHVETPVADLNLNLPAPLNQILQISGTYKSIAGSPPILNAPSIAFSGALSQLQDILNSLKGLLGIEFPFDVSVKAGTGATPSFVVHMELVFRVGDGPDGRIDIGMGKFYGQFLVRGELEAALTGVERALLFLEFQGDIQQAILPPLLYAGGMFRFSIELNETGPPVIDITLGLVISLGGDLIPGLIAVEATLNEGYSLDPATLDVGVLLGIEARAKLLGGLVGFSFSAEVMARIERNDFATVNIWAQIRVAATVQVAIFFKEDIHFDTQFRQSVPLAAVALVPGVGLAILPAALPL